MSKWLHGCHIQKSPNPRLACVESLKGTKWTKEETFCLRTLWLKDLSSTAFFSKYFSPGATGKPRTIPVSSSPSYFRLEMKSMSWLKLAHWHEEQGFETKLLEQSCGWCPGFTFSYGLGKKRHGLTQGVFQWWNITKYVYSILVFILSIISIIFSCFLLLFFNISEENMTLVTLLRVSDRCSY